MYKNFIKGKTFNEVKKMKKLKLKRFAVVGIYLAIFLTVAGGTLLMANSKQSKTEKEEIVDYVDDSILENDEIPVVQQETTKMIKPYLEQNVLTAKYFYDYQGEKENQEKAIIYHENTYIQNSGMDFQYENPFDVVAVLGGTVLDVREDELMGKTVEIKHDNGSYISVYQSLSETTVKKGDTVAQGQVIGKSGENTIDKEMGNHLHFELYQDGVIVDPAKHFDQIVQEKKAE